MKIGAVRLSVASLFVLAIQVALVSAIAGEYLYQRLTCPHVWTRTVGFDPEMPMRGRYLNLQLTVDGCQSTLPSAKQATFGRDIDGSANHAPYRVNAVQAIHFPARLAVSDNKLIAIRIPPAEDGTAGQDVQAVPGAPCDAMRLVRAVNFYVAEHAASPMPVPRGAELWIEVTVPPHGPPRPIQLALKQNNTWTPLAFQ